MAALTLSDGKWRRLLENSESKYAMFNFFNEPDLRWILFYLDDRTEVCRTVLSCERFL